MNAPTRPVLRYMGGKWRLAPWIIRHLPPHRTYVEPFGGAASVLLRKPRAYAEIYNDLDSEVVTLFRVLRDPDQAAELIRRIALTPFAREEFDATYATSDDPIETARLIVARSFMGHGSTAVALRDEDYRRRRPSPHRGSLAQPRRGCAAPSTRTTPMTIDYLEIVDQIESGIVPALSILQPYPHHIFHDGKDVENRKWPTSRRGWVIVHTGKKDTYTQGIERFAGLKRGGYVGMMRITDCVQSWPGKWFFGPYGFVIEDAFELPFFIPGPGAQSFFRPAPPFMAKICQGLRELAKGSAQA